MAPITNIAAATILPIRRKASPSHAYRLREYSTFSAFGLFGGLQPRTRDTEAVLLHTPLFVGVNLPDLTETCSSRTGVNRHITAQCPRGNEHRCHCLMVLIHLHPCLATRTV